MSLRQHLLTFLSRRFVLTLGCGVITSLLCWFGKIDGAIYATVIQWTVAAYITGGTTEKFTSMLKPQPKDPA